MKFALHIVLILCCSTTFGHCVQNTADTRNISNVDSAKTDIFIVMDVSLSMLAQDFQPNRLEAVKDASKVFIDTQKNSRIGLVVFAGEAYTASVVTLDHISLKSALPML